MPFMEWSDDLSVAVYEIDEQHKVLVRFINELHDAVAGGRGDTAVGDIMAGLVNYTVYHFFSEESLMESCGYPDYEQHRKEHINLTSKTMDLFMQCQSDRTALSDQVLFFLKDWLRNHIMVSDRKLAPFLKGNKAENI